MKRFNNWVRIMLIIAPALFLLCSCGLTKKCTSTDKFSEGLAWIQFEDQFGKYNTGCINTKGELVFFCPINGMDTTAFENGYGYINDLRNVYLVDTSGNVLASYPFAPSSYAYGQESAAFIDGARCWGGGYVLYQECHSNFDTQEFVYSIRDVNGNTLYSFTYEGSTILLDIYYLGDGIFAYKLQKDVINIYFAKNNTLIKDWNCYRDRIISLNDGTIVFNEGWVSSNVDSEFDYAYFSLTDVNGNARDVEIPKEYYSYKDQPEVVAYDSDYVLLEKKYDYYLLYDIKNDSFKKYDGEYADKLYWENAVGISQSVGLKNGTIAIQVQGKDGEIYALLLDTNFEKICEPIKGPKFKIEDNLLVISDLFGVSINKLYDLQGNSINAFYEYPMPENFAEGILTRDNMYMYYNGAPAFKKIKYFGSKKIDI